MIGRLDCLPKANNIPIGKEATMPDMPTISDRVKPPILRDSTNGKLIGIRYDKSPVKEDDRNKKNSIVITTDRVKLTDVDLITPLPKIVKLTTPKSTPI